MYFIFLGQLCLAIYFRKQMLFIYKRNIVLSPSVVDVVKKNIPT